MTAKGRIGALFLYLSFGLCVPFPALASGADDFEAGVAAFREHHYEVALAHFNAAYEAGLRAPTLHYNLGVAHFRLGHLEASYAAFSRIAHHAEWGPLAQYNLGLIRERQDRHSQAQSHFRAAYEATESPRLRQLAAAKLREHTDIARDGRSKGDWLGVLVVGGGFDDNVLLADDEAPLSFADDADYFIEFFGVVGRSLAGDARNGWRFDVGGYYRGYRDLDDFNVGVASTALTHHRTIGTWQLQLGTKLDLQAAGGEHFATVPGLRMQAIHRAGELRIALRNDLNYVSGGSKFDQLTGWQNRASIEGSLHRTAVLRAGYEFELNDRDDFASGSEFSSFSPQRHRFYFGAAVPLSARIEFDGRAEYRLSRYPDHNVRLDENDDWLLDPKRSEDRLTLRARMTFRPSVSWDVFAEYQHTDNDANIGRYRYDNQQFMLGLSRAF